MVCNFIHTVKRYNSVTWMSASDNGYSLNYVIIILCLGEHVKPLVQRLISPSSVGYISTAHYNFSCIYWTTILLELNCWLLIWVLWVRYVHILLLRVCVVFVSVSWTFVKPSQDLSGGLRMRCIFVKRNIQKYSFGIFNWRQTDLKNLQRIITHICLKTGNIIQNRQ